jgi:hypothetical protein
LRTVMPCSTPLRLTDFISVGELAERSAVG